MHNNEQVHHHHYHYQDHEDQSRHIDHHVIIVQLNMKHVENINP